jgi:ketosteroid isomerase-like protein
MPEPATTVAAVAPPAAAPAAPGPADETDAVIAAIESWRKAWTARDVQGYVASYTADYAPRGMTHGAWTAQRRDRLASASFVRVSIDELDVEFPDANTATARFVQGYSSDKHEDRVRKTLTLSRTASGWRIAREDSQPL